MRRLAWALPLLFAGCRHAPQIQTLEPAAVPGGRASVVRIVGEHFDDDAVVSIGGEVVAAKRVGDDVLEARVDGLKRGRYPVVVRSKDGESAARELVVLNAPPRIIAAERHIVRAGASFVARVSTVDPDGDAVQLRIDGAERTDAGFSVTAPDEDRTWTVKLTATDGTDTATRAIEIVALREPPTPRVDPPMVPLGGGRATKVVLNGANLWHGLTGTYDGVDVAIEVLAHNRVAVKLVARPRGTYALRLGPTTAQIEIGNSPPIVAPRIVEAAEQKTREVEVEAHDPDGDALRYFAVDLPPGATFDGERVRFTPDFIQGGRTYVATFAASDGTVTSTAAAKFVVSDDVRLPQPKVVSRSKQEDHDRVVLAQYTDRFLDPDGRTYEARLVVPHDTDGGRPLRVYLHGFGGRPYRGGRGDLFGLYPHDEDQTYWWGKQDPSGRLTPYTARRVLHLVAFVLKRFEGIDPNRVYIFGPSMGGAGAVTIGAFYARHFAYAYGTMGQMVPRLHRPSRREQLSGLWGPPSPAWDLIDIPRLLVESPEARNQFFLTRHGKDDPIIHFGAVLFRSPVVGLGYYEAAQQERVGHYAAWDEGAHGPPDPVLGAKWWEDDWDPATDPITRITRDRAFVAFSEASHDDDPGDPEGDGSRAFDPDRGYAGELEVVGDQGWGGDRTGTLNRGLRWDSRSLVDTIDRFEVKLRAEASVEVIATPRRVRRFWLRPREPVRWRHGAEAGEVEADESGAVSIPVKLSPTWSTLSLSRRAD
ncbi:MAG: IPT/TIG domain-containing protein [Deltaproteobacteria bacterium]|jgi:hypothetical protein